MREISPGLWHWTAPHDHIGMEVSSYYLADARVLVDPMLPPDGLDWFRQIGEPEHILLSNRHHDRDAWRLHEAFGCTVHCVRNGVHELEGRGPIDAFDFGDELRVQLSHDRGVALEIAAPRFQCASLEAVCSYHIHGSDYS